jgi:sugar O-acyltransferase (sialic acid O-acetyltransferase NeuD family)
MADIVIFGAGHAAAVAKVYIEGCGQHRIVGFTVDPEYATADCFGDLPLVPWDRLEESFPPGQVELLGPISFARMNEFRRERYREGKARNYRFASFIHPSSHIHTKDIGEHCFILDRTIVEPFVRIGNNVVIWGGCHFGHHSVIGEDCFLSGDVLLGARTRIGERCFLGARVAVRGDIALGAACLVGFGAVVQKDLAPGAVVVSRETNRLAKFPSSRMPDFR